MSGLDNIAVWAIQPNWEGGVTESLEWLTGVLASPVGTEQRFGLRLSPRRSFEVNFTLVGPIRTLFDLLIHRAGGSDIYLPIWPDVNKLSVATTFGSLSFIVEDGGNEFAFSPAAFIRGASPFDYEVVEIDTVVGPLVTLVNPTQRDWPAGTKVYPLQKFRIESQPQAARKADRAETVRVKFSSVVPNLFDEDLAYVGTYNSYPVLELEPNDIQDLTYEYQRFLAELDNQTGKRARVDLNTFGVTLQQYTWFMHRRLDHDKIRGLFYALQGRRYPIYVPTFFSDFEVISPVTGAALVVKRCGFTDFDGPFRGREHILVHLKDGTRHYRKITGSALIGDGATESITLATALPVIAVEAVKRISFLSLCRLDQDSIEIVHHTDTHGVATATTVFRSLPRDRVLVPTTNVVYFEVVVNAANSEHNICVGIANLDFTLTNPVQLNQNLGHPLSIGSAFVAGNGGSGAYGPGQWGSGRGYPIRFGNPPHVTPGQSIGVLVFLSDRLMYMCNASATPDTWIGDGGIPADPETKTHGCDFSDNITHGPLYILGGGGYDANTPLVSPSITLHAGASELVRSTPIPAGGVAWGNTTWNPNDKDGFITLSGQTCSVESVIVPEGAQSTAFVRSVSRKALV